MSGHPDKKEPIMIKLGPFVQLVNQKARLPVTYNMCHLAVMRGNVPAVQKNNRWVIDPAHVEAAARFFDAQPRNHRREAGNAADSAAA